MLNSIISAIMSFVISVLGVLGLHGGIEQPPTDTPVKEVTVSFESKQDFFDYLNNSNNIISEGNKESGYTYSVFKDSFVMVDNTNIHSSKLTIPSTLGGYKVIAVNDIGYSIFVKEVIFSEGIEFIFCPLEKMVNMESVTLPSTLKLLECGTFDKCRKLKNLTLPESVTVVSGSLCSECSTLEKVELGNNVKVIEGFAFAWCKSLTNIVLPETVEKIQTQAFDDCVSLNTINLPNALEFIGFAAFNDCENLKIDRLPDNLKEIDDFAFQNCKSLKELYIPNSVTKIGIKAFKGCPNLTIVSSSDYVIDYAKANGINYRVA